MSAIHLKSGRKTLCGRDRAPFGSYLPAEATCKRCLQVWRNRKIKSHTARALVAVVQRHHPDGDMRRAHALGVAEYHLEQLAYLTGVAEPIDRDERSELGLCKGIDQWVDRLRVARTAALAERADRERGAIA